MDTGSTVLIEYTPASGATQNITSYCIWSKCSFEMQMNAQPGTFTLTLKDPEQVLDFTTGGEICLKLDGVALFGGYVLQVSKSFFFPADDTSDGAENVRSRSWVLRGCDYNILFDKRVLRSDTGDYTSQLPKFGGNRKDGWVIKQICERFLDLPNGFNTDNVDEVNCVMYVESEEKDIFGYTVAVCDGDKQVVLRQQGTPFRDQIAEFAELNSAVFYIDANKSLHYKEIEDFECMWAFSDIPNYCPLENSAYKLVRKSTRKKEKAWRWTWQKTTIGFRDLEWVEDGSQLVNDALVWGGKALTSGDIVFVRRKSQDSIDNYNRWQYAEDRIGQDYFGTKQNVRIRAENIVGVDQISGVAGGMQRGLQRPQRTARLSWFAHDLPFYPSDHPNKFQRAYLLPGQFVNFLLYTFGEDGPTCRQPLWDTLPVRSVSITFLNLDMEGKGYVRFDGTFALSQSDPWNLWKFYDVQHRRRQRDAFRERPYVVDNDTPNAKYNDIGRFFPEEKPDGSRKVFTVKFGYVSGTLSVFVNGNDQTLGTNFVEVSPEDGTFRMMKAPKQGDTIKVECRTLEG